MTVRHFGQQKKIAASFGDKNRFHSAHKLPARLDGAVFPRWLHFCQL
jgi:hypothetical protein